MMKAAMSRHVQLPQQSTKKMFYDLNIVVTTPEGHSLHNMFMQIYQECGPKVFTNCYIDVNRQAKR